MSFSAIVCAIISMSILWGGFAYCLNIALKSEEK